MKLSNRKKLKLVSAIQKMKKLLASGYKKIPSDGYRQGDYELGSVITIGNQSFGMPRKDTKTIQKPGTKWLFPWDKGYKKPLPVKSQPKIGYVEPKSWTKLPKTSINAIEQEIIDYFNKYDPNTKEGYMAGEMLRAKYGDLNKQLAYQKDLHLVDSNGNYPVGVSEKDIYADVWNKPRQERPLPGEPLPEKPLPGEPLPEKPFPGRPFPERLGIPVQERPLPERPFPQPQPGFPGRPQPGFPEQPIGGINNPGGMGFWIEQPDGSYIGGDSFTGQTRPVGWDPNNPNYRSGIGKQPQPGFPEQPKPRQPYKDFINEQQPTQPIQPYNDFVKVFNDPNTKIIDSRKNEFIDAFNDPNIAIQTQSNEERKIEQPTDVLGSFKQGGVVEETGTYKLHEGEVVVPKNEFGDITDPLLKQNLIKRQSESTLSPRTQKAAIRAGATLKPFDWLSSHGINVNNESKTIDTSFYHPLNPKETTTPTTGLGRLTNKPVVWGDIAIGLSDKKVRNQMSKAIKNGQNLFVEVDELKDVKTPYGNGIFRITDTKNTRYNASEIDFVSDRLSGTEPYAISEFESRIAGEKNKPKPMTVKFIDDYNLSNMEDNKKTGSGLRKAFNAWIESMTDEQRAIAQDYLPEYFPQEKSKEQISEVR